MCNNSVLLCFLWRLLIKELKELTHIDILFSPILKPPFNYMCVISLGDGIPTVFVAVAGRSNGLGPVMSGNTAYPVINCPPLTPDWGAQDVWSSLRLPSGKMH